MEAKGGVEGSRVQKHRENGPDRRCSEESPPPQAHRCLASARHRDRVETLYATRCPEPEGVPSGSEQKNCKTRGPQGNGPSCRRPKAHEEGAERLLTSQNKPRTAPCMRWLGCQGSVPLARFRGGRGGALVVLGAADWAGAGLPLTMAPYVSFCKMLGAKLLCLSLARPAASRAKDAALGPSW